MIPDTAEIVVLAIICLATFGLLKLDPLGEWVWRLQRAVSSGRTGEPNSGPNGEETTEAPRRSDASDEKETQP